LIARAATRDAAELAAFATRVQAELSLPVSRALLPEDVEGTIILAAWLRSRGERDGFVFRLREEVPVAAQVEEWKAALESIVGRLEGAASSPPVALGHADAS